MKKAAILMLSLFFLCSFAGLSFAQKAQGKFAKKGKSNLEMISGKVVSIDVAKNEVVIKEEKSQSERVISVNPQMISSLKTDEEVRVKVEAGTNTAQSIKQINKNKILTKKREHNKR